MTAAALTNHPAKAGCGIIEVVDFQSSSLKVQPHSTVYMQLISPSGDVPADWYQNPRLKPRLDKQGYYPLNNVRFPDFGGTKFTAEAAEGLFEYLALLGAKSFRCRFRDEAGNVEQMEMTVASELKLKPQAAAFADTASAQPEPELKSGFAASNGPAPGPAPQPAQPAPAPAKKSVLPLIIGIIGAIVILIVIAILVKSLLFSAPEVTPPAASQESSQPSPEEESPAEAEPEPEPAEEPAAAPEPVTEPEAESVPEEEPTAASERAELLSTDNTAAGTEVQTAVSVPAAAAPAAAAPCTVDAASSDADLLKRCMASTPNDAVLLKFTTEALAAKKCDLAARLMISRARSLSEDFAMMYAKLLDPNSTESHECFEKNAQDAVYWYQKALEANSGNAKARDALKALGVK